MYWHSSSGYKIGTYLFNIVFRQRLGCDIYSILLHLFLHVRIFDNSFPLFTHDEDRIMQRGLAWLMQWKGKGKGLVQSTLTKIMFE
jgi:hypothetical protein